MKIKLEGQIAVSANLTCQCIKANQYLKILL